MVDTLQRLTFALMVFALAFTAAISVYGDAAEKSAWPALRPSGSVFRTQSGELPPAKPTSQDQSPPDLEHALTLTQALELAAKFSSDLAASAQDVLAAEGHARQAGAWPNPELEIETEEFGGADTREGFDAAETTVRITQPIELGGKRSRRQALARAEVRLAGWDYEAARLNVLTQTKQAFVDILAAQEKVNLAEAALRLAEDVRRVAAERVKAGKVPELEETKAVVEVSSAGIAFNRAKRELEVARKLLAANWGSETPRFAAAVGSLDAVKDLGPRSVLEAAVDQSPEVVRWNDELAATKEALALAKAQRIPDVAVSAGISRFEEDSTHAAVAGLSLPLPLFDHNEGGIAAARHQALRAEQKQHAARVRAATALAEAHGRFESARTEAVAIREELLPAAQKAFAAAQTGYRQGKFGFLEVLDAQRTLNEAKATQLDALAAYHKAAAELERITGMPLNTIQ